MLEILGFVTLGLITGFVASTLGVGGGIIFVPTLVVVFSFPQQLAQGTSLAVIVPTAVVGTYLHAKRGRVDWHVAGMVAVGAIAGGLIVAWLAQSLDPSLLRRLFAGLLIVVAVRMVSS